MSNNVIQDGYTRDGYLDLSDLGYDPLSFEYRPALPEDTQALDVQLERLDNSKGKGALLTARFCQERLTSWSETNGSEDAALPHDLDNVRRLPDPMLRGLHGIISGWRASDPKPAADKTADDIESELAAIDRELSGATEVAEDQGN